MNAKLTFIEGLLIGAFGLSPLLLLPGHIPKTLYIAGAIFTGLANIEIKREHEEEKLKERRKEYYQRKRLVRGAL